MGLCMHTRVSDHAAASLVSYPQPRVYFKTYKAVTLVCMHPLTDTPAHTHTDRDNVQGRNPPPLPMTGPSEWRRRPQQPSGGARRGHADAALR